MTIRRLCLVTGASAGIGAACAHEYARHGWDVALVARRADRLQNLQSDIQSTHGVEALVFPADLTEPDASDRLVDQAHQSGRRIDGLINNAGYGLKGHFTSYSAEEQKRFNQLMLTAPTELCRLTLPGMQERNFGRIINVSSVRGLVPGSENQSLYGPVKSYLVCLSEALNEEFRGTNVHVTALCPGFTRTEFHDVQGRREGLDKTSPGFAWASAESVARSGYRACEANAAVRVPGALYKTLTALARTLPDGVVRAIMRNPKA